MERIDPTYAYDTPTHSVAIAPMSILTVVFSEVGDPQPSMTTTIGSFTRNPIGFVGSPWDLYEFIDALPLQKFDPLGLAGRCSRRGDVNPCEGETRESYVLSTCGPECVLAAISPGYWNMPSIATGCQSQGQSCADSVIPNIGNPPENQAIRHCVASACLRCNFGASCGRCAANAREQFQRMCEGQTCSASQRGVSNKSQGIDGAVGCQSACQDCIALYRAGRLDTRPEIADAGPDCSTVGTGAPRHWSFPLPYVPRVTR